MVRLDVFDYSAVSVRCAPLSDPSGILLSNVSMELSSPRARGERNSAYYPEDQCTPTRLGFFDYSYASSPDGKPSDLTVRQRPEGGYQSHHVLQTFKKSAASRLCGSRAAQSADPPSPMGFSRQRVLAVRPSQPSSPIARQSASSSLSPSVMPSPERRPNAVRCPPQQSITEFYPQTRSSSAHASSSTRAMRLVGDGPDGPHRIVMLRPTVLGLSADLWRARSVGCVSVSASPVKGTLSLLDFEIPSAPEMASGLSCAGSCTAFGSLYSSRAASPTFQDTTGRARNATAENSIPRLGRGASRMGDCSPEREWGSQANLLGAHTPLGSERSIGSKREEFEEELGVLSSRIASILVRQRQRGEARMRKERQEAQLLRLEKQLYGAIDAREEQRDGGSASDTPFAVALENNGPLTDSDGTAKLLSVASSSPNKRELEHEVTGKATAPPSQSLVPSLCPPVPTLRISSDCPSGFVSLSSSPRGFCTTEVEARESSEILLKSACVVIPLWPDREYCRVIVKGPLGPNV